MNTYALVFLFLIGFTFCAIGTYLGYRTVSLLHGGISLTATVVALDEVQSKAIKKTGPFESSGPSEKDPLLNYGEKRVDTNMIATRIQYEFQNQTYNESLEFSTKSALFEKDQKIQIWVDPNEPTRFVTNHWVDLWLPATMCFAFGLPWILCVLVFKD